jgi:hypothetical protein
MAMWELSDVVNRPNAIDTAQMPLQVPPDAFCGWIDLRCRQFAWMCSSPCPIRRHRVGWDVGSLFPDDPVHLGQHPALLDPGLHQVDRLRVCSIEDPSGMAVAVGLLRALDEPHLSDQVGGVH